MKQASVQASLIGLSVAFAFVAGKAQAADTDGASPTEIRIGMVNAQSGPAAALGLGMLHGAQAVFNETNAKGGVHNRKIVLIKADDGYEPDQTLAQTFDMIKNDQVLALFGYVGTPTVNAVLPLIESANVPLIGVFSGAQSLRNPLKRQVFNVRASYEEETEMLVAQLMQDGAKKIAVVYQNDGFGLSVLTGTERALKKRGTTLHATGTFQRNTVAIRFALAMMVEAQPDAIVLVGPYLPVATFINKARAIGLNPPFATVSFVGTESLMALLEPNESNVFISQVVPFPSDDTLLIARNCRAALKKEMNELLTFTNFEGCISARLLVSALELAGPDLSRETLTASLEKLRATNLEGLKVTLSAEDHQALDDVFLTKITNGKIINVR